MSADKAALRLSAKAVRKAAVARHGADAGKALARAGIAFAAPNRGAIVSCYLAIAEELDPMPLFVALGEAGHPLALPVMQGRGKPLIMKSWTPGDPLKETMWGIQEPLESAEIVAPDVVLVPLLAFDANGYRLGYGGGFYDRTLAELRAIKPHVVAIGLALDEQKVDAVPHEHYDQRLDWVLTPSGPMRVQGV